VGFHKLPKPPPPSQGLLTKLFRLKLPSDATGGSLPPFFPSSFSFCKRSKSPEPCPSPPPSLPKHEICSSQFQKKCFRPPPSCGSLFYGPLSPRPTKRQSRRPVSAASRTLPALRCAPQSAGRFGDVAVVANVWPASPRIIPLLFLSS